ncbi:hypothetical protein N431DRAFT_427844 [Stipitochalara longipes BDJ]|nr:hypothetical protein N431DRAFT_427844 [Stipitochalara longipes BDJ]
MSFLTRTPLLRAGRTTFASHANRAFSTTLVSRKVVPDVVKEPVKKIDRAVSDKLVDGIELGRMSPPLFSNLIITSHPLFIHSSLPNDPLTQLD